MGALTDLDLAKWVRPESYWTSEQMEAVVRFWRIFYEAEGLPNTSVKRFQLLLGPQLTTVQLRHRCWLWVFDNSALFVDKRGPAFHVASGLTPEESFDEWKRFQHRIEVSLGELRP